MCLAAAFLASVAALAAAQDGRYRLPAGLQAQWPPDTLEASSAAAPDPVWAHVFRTGGVHGPEFALGEIGMPWAVSWLFRAAPEWAMAEFEARADAEFRQRLRLGPGDGLLIEPVSVSGFPGLQVAVERRAGSPQRAGALDGGVAGRIGRAREIALHIVLVDGRFAVAACWGERLDGRQLAFFESLQMPREREPGDIGTQWRWLCILSGCMLLLALGLAIGLIVVVDKAVKRRRRARRAAGAVA